MLDEAQSSSVLDLPLARLRLRFQVGGKVRFPEAYTGSAWRGALGHALRQAACITRLDRCDPCLLRYECPYAYIFETPPPPETERMRKYPAAPHPFVLEPEEVFAPGGSVRVSGQDEGRYELGLVLVGRAIRHAPYIVWTLSRAAERGIGAGRASLVLEEVLLEDRAADGGWQRLDAGPLPRLRPLTLTLPDVPQGVRIRFLTPLRLARDGRVVREGDLSFSVLLRNLLRRISLLHYFHGRRALELDFRALAEASGSVEWEAERLEWVELSRRSSRQGRRMPLDGVVGSVRLEGKAAAPFWPFLVLGGLVHAGKAATMGLGRYRIEAVAP